MNRDSLRALLIKHEDIRPFPYLDCCGKAWRECQCEIKGYLTIGIGRCIEKIGISISECDTILDNDLSRIVSECRNAFAWFNDIDDTRQNVIASMCFNMGLEKLKTFTKMLAAVQARNFTDAANQMLASVWAAQVGSRAVELASMMRDGDTRH